MTLDLRPTTTRGAAAAALLAGVLVTACGTTAGPSPTPSFPEAWTFAAALPRSPEFVPPPADSAWTRAVESVGEDGIPDRETALRLFALAIGPVPGVDVEPDGKPIPSASFAIRAVRAHWDALTADQRLAIETALELPADAVTIEIPPVEVAPTGGTVLLAGPIPREVLEDPGPVAEATNHPYVEELLKALRSAGAWVRSTIAARLGDDINGSIEITIAPCGIARDAEAAGREAIGCAEPRYGSAPPGSLWGTGAYQGCRVRIASGALSGGGAVVVNTLAHEIFHCFQFHGYGTAVRFATAPAWVVEGGAEWVGNDLTGDLAETDWSYEPWFLKPGTSLLGRTYSAVGFWGHLAESGKSPYDVFPFVWLAGDSATAFRSSTAADSEAFLNSWASSVTRESDRGRDWDTEGAGIPGQDLRTPPEAWEVPNGSSVEIHAEPYTVRVFQLAVSADVIRISGSGHARINDGAIDTVGFPTAFCTHDGGCDPCPGQAAVPPAPLANDPYFVVTGGAAGATFTIVGEAIDTQCPTPTPPPSTPPSPNDEFCRRVRALLEWSANPTAEELSREWARYIHAAAVDMRAVAPAEMVPHVDVLIEVYGTYAEAPEPINVPMVGPAAAKLAQAVPAIYAYCEISQ